MGKFLKVLVVLLLLLSIASLVLGIMLFVKREILKGRTQKLETTLIALGALIEEQPAELEEKPKYTSRDISPCTSEPLEQTEFSDFWEAKFTHELEMQDQATMDINSRKRDLMSYYMRDPVETYFLTDVHKVMRDVNGFPVTKGEGTMQSVLDDIIQKQEEQLDRLNRTRQQLTALRIELIDTIEDLNGKKAQLREALKTIVELNNEIDRLNAQIADLETRIAELEEEKRQLQDTIAEIEAEIAQLKETLLDRDAQIEQQEKMIADLRAELARGRKGFGGGEGGDPDFTPPPNLEPGPKGTVASVNENWNFVVMQMNADFMREILARREPDKPIPRIELMVRRPGQDGKFVTKIRIFQVKRDEQLGVADILTDWQQLPVQKGDIVFSF